MITVRHFAAAAEAAGTHVQQVAATTVDELRVRLVAEHGAQMSRVLEQCSLLSSGRRLEAQDTLPPDAVVDVLPPFAGG